MLKQPLPALAGALLFSLTLVACSTSEPALPGADTLPKITSGGCRIGPDAFVLRNDLASGTPAANGRLMVRFVQTSDEHILDEDGHVINGGAYLDPLYTAFESAQRFQDEYTDEVMNRMIATINDCHTERPIEFSLATGDNTDLGTVAEVRRYIDNRDGTFDQLSHFERTCREGFPAGTPEPVLDWACTRFTGRGTADTQTVDPDPDDPTFQLLHTRMVQQLADTEQAVLSGRTCVDNESPETETCSTDPANQTFNRSPGLPPDLRCNAGEPGCKNLRSAVPYYVAFGNHDGYIRGTLVTEPGLQEASIPFGRHYMKEQCEFIQEFFETTAQPGPVGHGFANARTDGRSCDDDPHRRDGGYYAFNAGGGKFRMIVLNTVIDGTDPRIPGPLQDLKNPFALADGTVDGGQFEWLKTELAKARTANQLVLVFSHHPDLSFAEFGNFAPLLPGEPDFIRAETLNAELASYPNVIAWVAGHTHRHRIRAFKVENGTGSNGAITAPVNCKGPSPCTGFWQIETASLIDDPQESRILEIYDNRNGTGTILAAVLQHDFERSKALAERDDRCQFYPAEDPASVGQIITDGDLSVLCSQGGTRQGEPGDRNVRLMFRMP
jgi:3',5'-cyclic AMP phosphodiesterase CpdA